MGRGWVCVCPGVPEPIACACRALHAGPSLGTMWLYSLQALHLGLCSCALQTKSQFCLSRQNADVCLPACLLLYRCQSCNAYQSEQAECSGVSVQPLYAPHVKVAKGVYKDIIIIATEFNSVYGFDAGEPACPDLLGAST